jgi:hypothetical protein
MQNDADTWDEVRLAYADASRPLAEIAARFGLTPMRIGAKAKREGWPARKAKTASVKRTKKAPVKRTKTAKPEGGAPAASRPAGSLPTRGAQRALIGRLYRAISLKLEHMEKRMASGEARSAQDEERESRALATLINNFEKVTEAVAGLDNERDATRAAGRAGADAERMRREIAERLERLHDQRLAQRDSQKP